MTRQEMGDCMTCFGLYASLRGWGAGECLYKHCNVVKIGGKVGSLGQEWNLLVRAA